MDMSSKTEPSCIHYKHSKVLLAIYGRKMNAKNISSISLKLLMLVQNVTPLYQIIVNPSLGKVIEKQLIFGPTYSYTYTILWKRRKNSIYYKGTLRSGGKYQGVSDWSEFEKGDTIKVFSVPFIL
jgi:hypothetical protein